MTDTATRPHKCVTIGRCGPVPIGQVTALHLAHVSHHLSFLEPKQRRKLHYADEAAVIADVNNLRRGCIRHGSWSLAQTCGHLAAGVRSRMAPCPDPMPANTPGQEARKPDLVRVLASGRLPSGIPAPASMVPPDDAGDPAIDDFLEVLKTFANYTGRMPPHRVFGIMSDADARRLNLIHCAHHLSYLEPF
jgi:hypothetical protein